MIKDITIGQYYEADSKIHSLDPRLKLVGTFVFLISLFLFDNVANFVFITVFLVSVIKMSKVPFKYMIKGMKAIAFLLFITVLFNLLFTGQQDPIFVLGPVKISMMGIKLAATTTVRLTYLILGSSLMTLTTTPNQLTDAIEALLNPLKIVKFPVHEVAMMMSIALRFIPILVEETDKIMKAQMARGADFETGGLIKKAKAMIPLLVPLFISAFRRANDLAMAMEARGYRGGEGRTKFKPLKYKSNDRMAYAVIWVYLLLVTAIKILSPI